MSTRFILEFALLVCVSGSLTIAADSPSAAWLPLWQFQREGKEIDSCAEYGGLIVAVINRGPIVALKAATGEIAWERDVGEVSVDTVSFSRDDRDFVFVNSMESVVALDRKTGEFRWLRLLPHGASSAAAVGDVVCVASFDGNTYGLDINDGKIIWTTEWLTDAPADPPGFDGNRARFSDHPARPGKLVTDGTAIAFSVFDQCRALAFDAKTGKRLATYPTQGWMYMKPVLTEKHIFVGSQDKHVYCFDRQTGGVVWKFATGSRVEAECAVTDKHVFFGSCDGNLYCASRMTGEQVWKFTTEKHPKYGGPIYETPVLDGNTVILPAMQGQIYAVDATTGKRQSSYQPSPLSQIDGAEWDGTRLFVQTRKNFDNEGEEVLYAIGRETR